MLINKKIKIKTNKVLIIIIARVQIESTSRNRLFSIKFKL